MSAQIDELPRHGDPLAKTHEVLNQPPALEDYNLYTQDRALQDWVRAQGAGWAEDSLTAFGALAGRAETIELGFQANENPPVLDTHDRYGHRVDRVRFHPAYHELMRIALEHGLHSSPWTEPGPGAHVSRAAHFYMQMQVEPGHGCPVSMTFAAVPALRHQPEIAARWLPKVTARAYDPRNVPDGEKSALTIGMAMTEKQGGSDVRANTTRAYPLGAAGPGQAYELIGHKYFVSAPMCDAFLVLAKTDKGLSCFLLPRWRPDGEKNPLQIQRLKRKMGNAANASSETELRGALAWMIGEEGRGVRTIIDMVAATRFDCMMGSAAGMRQAVAQVTHHARYRSVFGERLDRQPLMQNVLADLALESEAALAFTLRMGHALDHLDDDHERLLARIATPVGKYWVCKRTAPHAAEAMECIGGSGVMEDCIMPRLFRESPVNAIWEGSGNVQCLDVLRAVEKEPAVMDAFLAELHRARGADDRFDRFTDALKDDLADTGDLVYRARDLVDRMALAMQGSLLLRGGNAAVAGAFCAGRLAPSASRQFGSLPRGVDVSAIVERATPVS